MSKKTASKPKNNARQIFFIFSIICALLVLIDVVIPRHGHIEIEEYVGFYSVYGFVSCVIIVLISKYLARPVISKEEDYHDH